MTKSQNIDSGALIVNYARAKWGTAPDPKKTEKIGTKLGRNLQLRLDVLGIDGERLLNIEPQEALRVLEGLEREAECENFEGVRRDDPFDDAAVVRTNRPGARAGRSHPNKRARGKVKGADRRRPQH